MKCGDDAPWQRVGTALDTTFTYTGVLPDRVACLFSVAAIGPSGETGPLAEPVMYLNGRSRFLEPAAISSRVSAGDVPPVAYPSGMIPAVSDVSHLASFADGSLVFVDGRQVRRFTARGELETLLSLHDDEGDIAGLAVDPRFATNGFVFVCMTDRGTDPRFATRVVRYREVGGSLGEPLVVAVGIPRPAHGLVPMAVDAIGQVYVAVGRLASGDTPYAGRVLRISSEAGTGSATPGTGPVVAAGVSRPLAVGLEGDGLIWVADQQEGLVALGRDGARRVSVEGQKPWTGAAFSFEGEVKGLFVDVQGSLFVVRERDGRVVSEGVQASVPDGWAVSLVHMTHTGRVHAVLKRPDPSASGIFILQIP